MLTEYLNAALMHARYEILHDDNSFYGEIQEFPGVYANESTLEECRRELAATLEDWVLVRIHRHLDLPKIDGLELSVHALAAN